MIVRLHAQAPLIPQWVQCRKKTMIVHSTALPPFRARHLFPWHWIENNQSSLSLQLYQIEMTKVRKADRIPPCAPSLNCLASRVATFSYFSFRNNHTWASLEYASRSRCPNWVIWLTTLDAGGKPSYKRTPLLPALRPILSHGQRMSSSLSH